MPTKDEALAALGKLAHFAHHGPESTLVATLRQYIESTARDVERLDWMEQDRMSTRFSCFSHPLGMTWFAIDQPGDFPTLRAAIDAAIAQKDKP